MASHTQPNLKKWPERVPTTFSKQTKAGTPAFFFGLSITEWPKSFVTEISPLTYKWSYACGYTWSENHSLDLKRCLGDIIYCASYGSPDSTPREMKPHPPTSKVYQTIAVEGLTWGSGRLRVRSMSDSLRRLTSVPTMGTIIIFSTVSHRTGALWWLLPLRCRPRVLRAPTSRVSTLTQKKWADMLISLASTLRYSEL